MSDSAPQRPTNRLAHETSPYLQQHAHNPVDWYPWGEEAFQRARDEDKAIFLSVGYSACHWCHVMEHESFENDRIAAVMNEHFVNIKVDREERPDVDQIYMSAVQLMTQRGGWPMSVFLTPDGRPFYGGTYWPPESRMGMPGFRDILLKISEFWSQRRDEVNTSANSLVEAIGQIAAPDVTQQTLNEEVLRNAMNSLLSAADRTHGGFGGAPKFPHPMDVRVLLRGWKRFGNQDALDISRLTLDKMARGGIYDHLGGGFHRYSTDAQWLVPHFEKMLYDNALLTPAYLEFIQCAPEESAAHIRSVRETLDYVLREMTHESGAFFSTQDADSEGEEGKFFVWTEEEILEQLDPADARLFNYCYDVTPRGNWEGKTILNRPKPHDQAAKVLGVDSDELQTVLDRSKRKLFEVRAERVAPGRDDKFITAWNGMMITAFAQAAQVLDEPTYAEAARRAADAIWEHLRDERGRLLHSSKDDRPGVGAFLDDYACLIDGLVELYQAEFDSECLVRAVELAEQLIEHFADEDRGGFFYTANDHEELIARSKDTQDSATPSGNGMAATALLKLGRITGRSDLESHARRTLESLSGMIAEHPRAGGQALLALDAALGPAHEIVLVDGADPTETETVLRQLHGKFLPGKLVLRRLAGVADEDLPEAVRPLLTAREPGDELTVYVCEAGTCGLPARGLSEASAAIDAISGDSSS